ncbi:E3 ubiquitin-protein ligase AIRP2 [Linum perenne]
MMEMMYMQLGRKSSYQDLLKALEADIHHANSLAAEIPREKGGLHLQMKLVYNQWAPLFLNLLQSLDCSSCICLLPRYLNLFHILVYKVRADGRQRISASGRKATVKEFYGVILPSLQRLHSSLDEPESLLEPDDVIRSIKISNPKKNSDGDLHEDECGICLEPCTKMVLPSCFHAMCIKCYNNWNTRSESCPFCRGSLKRVNSEDLWVLTCKNDVVDTKLITREDLSRFYLYINNLPNDYPDVLFLVYYEYLF